MPQKDTSHNIIKQALINDGWEITDDPYVINYGRLFLYIDLGATSVSGAAQRSGGVIIGAQRDDSSIAIEIKEFRGPSLVADLQQAVGQYVMYQLLLKRTDPERQLYLAITSSVYERLFNQTIARIMVEDVPLWLVIIDTEQLEIKQWIQPRTTGKL
jgi:hypothetical protein